MTSPYSIVLDLDETLVSMVDEEDHKAFYEAYENMTEEQKSRCFKMKISDFNRKKKQTEIVDIIMIERKGLIKFLSWAFGYFQNVFIWSAGVNSYVREIDINVFRKNGFNPSITLTRDDCETVKNDCGKEIMIKPLDKIIRFSKVKINRDKLFILEDRYSSVQTKDRENIILINKFEPKLDDIETLDDDHLTLIINWFEALNGSNKIGVYEAATYKNNYKILSRNKSLLSSRIFC